MREKNEEKAIELYKLSAANTSVNDQQKATTYLTLADYFYGKKQYIPAQAYYDSCLQNLRPDYKDIDRISSRAVNLNKLVSDLNTIALQDSLLYLASLSEREQLNVVEGIIRNLRDKETEAQQREMAEAQNLNLYNNRTLTASNTGMGKWYFYNTVSVQQGLSEFQSRWGKRKLEDNWRRRNKGVNIGTSESTEMAGGLANPSQENKISDNKNPSFIFSISRLPTP
ncbi:MAG: hypothetical protein HC905_29415 [Bacteroidales bacterium]|nr:hypothetical protein [Bacteroidales bacterium]